MRKAALVFYMAVLVVCMGVVGRGQTYDVVIAGGRIYDGSGKASYVADVGIKEGRIAAIGQLQPGTAQIIRAQGLAVAPGFINMLSWATDCLLVDGRSQSDIRQGVTLEVMGEGESMGPLNEVMKRDMVQAQGDLKFRVEWTTLGEYLECLVRKGVSTNVASFMGATTARVHTVGYEDRPATAQELQKMRELVRAAMQEGALGVSSALIYAPGAYARADELTALAEVAGQYGGLYISHLRSEGDRLLEALDDLIATARKANVAAELYHMKAAGKSNWDKCDAMIQKIEKARAEGLRITADMYTYTAAATGLDAAMPPWVQEGGHRAWVARLRDPLIRQRVVQEMTTPGGGWENFYLLAGAPENILLVGFKNEKLKPLIGKTLAQVAALQRKVAAGDRDRSGRRGRQPGQHGLLPDVGREREETNQAPVGQLLFGRGVPRPRGSLSQIEHAPPCLRDLRPAAWQIRPGREGHPAGRGDSAAVRPAGGEPQARPAREARKRIRRRYRCLRPGHRNRSRDLREAAPVRHRRDSCIRQRNPGPQRW